MLEVERTKLNKELSTEMKKRKGILDKKHKEKHMGCYDKANGDVESYVKCATKMIEEKDQKLDFLHHKIYHAMYSFESCVGDYIESQKTIKACRDAAKKVAFKYFDEFVHSL